MPYARKYKIGCKGKSIPRCRIRLLNIIKASFVPGLIHKFILHLKNYQSNSISTFLSKWCLEQINIHIERKINFVLYLTANTIPFVFSQFLCNCFHTFYFHVYCRKRIIFVFIVIFKRNINKKPKI